MDTQSLALAISAAFSKICTQKTEKHPHERTDPARQASTPRSSRANGRHFITKLQMSRPCASHGFLYPHAGKQQIKVGQTQRSPSDLVEGREDDGVRRVLWEVDVQRRGVLGVRVGLDGSDGVQHLFKFIWGRTKIHMQSGLIALEGGMRTSI